MESLLGLASTQPLRALASGEVLIDQGSTGGDLFIVESGRLAVERDGVKIATVATAGAMLGEMSVLLGKPSTATVKAEGRATVRVIRDAATALERDPALTFLVAKLVAGRLDATSAVLVNLSKKHTGKIEQGLLATITSVLNLPAGGDFSLMNREDLFG